MKKVWFVLLTSSLLVLFANAEEKKIEYKKWKTLQNINGFEFKYPECWNIIIGGSEEEETDPAKMKFPYIVEGDSCKTPLLRNGSGSNGVGFSMYQDPYKSRKEYDDIVKNREKWAKDITRSISDNELKDRSILVINFTKNENYLSTAYAEWLDRPHPKAKLPKGSIRWKMELYCPHQHISIGGPIIDNPDPSYIAKFQKGDIALPEPYKTIYESIKCIEPKKVEKKKIKK